jgi:hypothetical protein
VADFLKKKGRMSKTRMGLLSQKDKKESTAIIFMVNNSVLTTMLTTAGTEVKTVEYCSW